VKNRLTNVLLIILILLVAFLTVLRIIDRAELDRNLQEAVRLIKSEVPSDGYTPVKGVDYFDGKDGYTPVKYVDYFDGKDGTNGADGKDGANGEDGKDAYFDIRCNTNKNRWEIKYMIEESWQVLNGEAVSCTTGV
jgi:hypothetical protein